MEFNDFLAKLGKVKKVGEGYTAKCPAHNDRQNSLSVSEKTDKIILNCHAGCSVNEVCAALDLKLSDLFSSGTRAASNRGNEQKRVVAVYDYQDENGVTLYQNVRFEPKDFRQRHFENGREIWGLNGTRRIPYRLPELIKAREKDSSEIIFLTEGEKDCDNLRQLSLTASSFKSWKPEFVNFLEGANVVILTDHDRAGLKQAHAVGELLAGQTATLKIVNLFESEPLPEKHGKDVSDWLQLGNGRTELETIITGAPFYDARQSEAMEEKSSLKPLASIKFSDITAKPVEWLWNPFLALGTFNLLEGEEGIGKTFLICALAAAIGTGSGLPTTPEHTHIEPSNVLLISAEDSLAQVLKPRLESMGAPCDRIIAVEEPFSLDRDGLLRLSLTLAREMPKFVVIDPLFSYTGRMNLDRDNDIRAVTDGLKRLAEKHNCCIVGVRHIGKSKGFGDARNAGLNGVGWRASARSVLLIGKNPENEFQKALCQTKNNLAPRFEKSIGFEIRDANFYWTGESSLTAETMLSSIRSETGDERAGRDEAIAFLKESLSDGARAAKDLKREAFTIGLTEQNLRTARAKLAVVVFKEGGTFGGNPRWLWQLPATEDVNYPAEDVSNNTEDVSKYVNQHLQANRSNKTSYDNDLAEDVSYTLSPHLQARNQHLQSQNQHLQATKNPLCANCGLEMSLTDDQETLFCSLGCGSRKAEI